MKCTTSAATDIDKRKDLEVVVYSGGQKALCDDETECTFTYTESNILFNENKYF